MYYDDNEDLLPRESFGLSSVVNTWIQVNAASSFDVWYNAVPPMLSHPPASSFATHVPDFYEPASLFHCPSVKFPANAGTSSRAFFSMAMNSRLINGTNTTMRLSTLQRAADHLGAVRGGDFLERLLDARRDQAVERFAREVLEDFTTDDSGMR